jgi:hypothetical protein
MARIIFKMHREETVDSICRVASAAVHDLQREIAAPNCAGVFDLAVHEWLDDLKPA